MTATHRACSTTELRTNGRMEITIEGKDLILFALDNGEFVATSALCPHANGPLIDGEIEGSVLTCPWHGWGFDLTTGISPDDPCMHLERFEVRLDGDDVWVSM